MNKIKKFLINIKISILRIIWRLKYTFAREKMPKNKDGKVYVNLGCGVNTSSEFVNIDAIPFKHTHWIANIQNLFMFPNNSVDMIYASHVIEHIPRKNVEQSLSEWLRVLKNGGVLRFGVPNFDALVEIYNLSGKNTESIVNQLLGQDGEYDDHHTIWNFEYAKKLLESVGFVDVKFWDPKQVEHHEFHDKTLREIEVGGKKISISLNIEATKR